MKQTKNKLTKGDKIITAILGSLLIIPIIFYYNSSNTTKEEYNEPNDKNTYQVSEIEPLDTYGIYVYIAFYDSKEFFSYNGDEILGEYAHEDLDCFLLDKECFGSSLYIKSFRADIANYDEKYEHIKFCPFCSHYSDYYLNGDPR